MTPEIVVLLSRHFSYDRRALARLGPLSEAEHTILAEAGHPPGRETAILHDDAVSRLRVAAARLKETDVAHAYLAGLAGAFQRGRQPIISFAFAQHLPPHEKRCNKAGSCLVCGLPDEASVDPVDQEVRLHCGWSWNELPHHFVIDLDTFEPSAIPLAAVEAGRSVLRALLRFIEEQPSETTPGALDKAIARAKLLPEKDKYKRYGLLVALAEAGVLPNQLLTPALRGFSTPPERWTASERLKGSPRSDIPLPLAAWRGALGVDWAAASAVFGVER